MSIGQPTSDEQRENGLIFMLSQLRDDLGELVEGLESKSLPYEATEVVGKLIGEGTQREQSGRSMGQLWDDEQIATVANDLK